MLPTSTVLEAGTTKMSLYSNSSTSSMVISIQPSPSLSPTTVMSTTTSETSTVELIGGSWESMMADDSNPYIPLFDPWVYAGLAPSSSMDSSASSIQSYCGNSWRSTYLDWIATAENQMTRADQIYCDASTVTDPRPCWTITESALPPFPFIASPPCCSSCTYTAGDVQVYHWPTVTTAPSVTMLVNSDGFTLYVSGILI
jgi:hypothetical protein